MTPNERKQRLATFMRTTDPACMAMVDPSTGALRARINGVNHTWSHCPTFRDIRQAMGLPIEYITCTGVQS